MRIAKLGAILWSQQVRDDLWETEALPVADDDPIPCMNPHCSSDGFVKDRISESVEEALESGSVVAGALRCDGMNRHDLTPCDNVLAYIWEDEPESD